MMNFKHALKEILSGITYLNKIILDEWNFSDTDLPVAVITTESSRYFTDAGFGLREERRVLVRIVHGTVSQKPDLEEIERKVEDIVKVLVSRYLDQDTYIGNDIEVEFFTIQEDYIVSEITLTIRRYVR